MINVSNEENKESPCLTSAINELKNEQEALEKEKINAFIKKQTPSEKTEKTFLDDKTHCLFSVTTIVMVVAFPLFGFLSAFAPAPVVFGAFFVFVIVLMLVL